MKFVHMRSFPFGYEINALGHCRKMTPTGYVKYRNYAEPNGMFVDIPVGGRVNKCLVAELVLLSFSKVHLPGNIICYRDKDIYNVEFTNLQSDRQPPPPQGNPAGTKQRNQMKLWGCESRAYNANKRCAASQQIISAIDVHDCLKSTAFCCFYCGESLSPLSWHMDHFRPLSRGGVNTLSNLRAACPICNLAKSDQTMDEFVIRISRILSKHSTRKVNEYGQKIY